MIPRDGTVIRSRTPSPLVRSGLWPRRSRARCPGLAYADPLPSRDYPPTYSSRKAPWYDPFGLVHVDRQEVGDDCPSGRDQARRGKRDERSTGNRSRRRPGSGTATARRPRARIHWLPMADTRACPETGTARAAQRRALSRTASRFPASCPILFRDSPVVRASAANSTIPIIPPKGPELPNVATPNAARPAADVDWQSSPARLRVPRDRILRVGR